VINCAGDILLIRRTDNRNWALPGGAIDLGESVAQAAARETLEETGIECAITGIVGIYSDPKHVILYTSNGEVRQEFSIVLTAIPLSGEPTPSSESSEVRWVPEAELLGYTMDRSMRIRINDFLSRNESPNPACPRPRQNLCDGQSRAQQPGRGDRRDDRRPAPLRSGRGADHRAVEPGHRGRVGDADRRGRQRPGARDRPGLGEH
jgi:8-oxo-dGTP pyrophosphatase MutT (NUDIX family)